MAHGAALPKWVIARDGRITPFEADRIAERLFDATAALGRPDPLLGRELANGVLHFLAREPGPPRIDEAELAELMVKFIRELGHPELAKALECNPDYRSSIPSSEPWAADVNAAIAGGLLQRLEGRSDSHLLGGALRPIRASRAATAGWVEAFVTARKEFERFIAVDSPEWLFDQPGDDVFAWTRELRWGLRATGLAATINLNVATAPAWANEAAGPLFPESPARTTERLNPIRNQLLTALFAESAGDLRIDWHFSERDLASGAVQDWLEIAMRAVGKVKFSFVPDRPDQPAALAEGIDRRRPDLLGAIGLSLPRLGPVDSGLNFAVRLKSAVSLASAYGRARRADLRRRADCPLTDGFRLDRARLLVAPIEGPTQGDSQQQTALTLINRVVCDDSNLVVGSVAGLARTLSAPATIPLPIPSTWIDESGTVIELSAGLIDSVQPSQILRTLSWAMRHPEVTHIRLRPVGTMPLPLKTGW
jgi:hypothetical protein